MLGASALSGYTALVSWNLVFAPTIRGQVNLVHYVCLLALAAVAFVFALHTLAFGTRVFRRWMRSGRAEFHPNDDFHVKRWRR